MHIYKRQGKKIPKIPEESEVLWSDQDCRFTGSMRVYVRPCPGIHVRRKAKGRESEGLPVVGGR